MTFNSEALLDRLRSFEQTATPATRYLVAFSGGMDSTVLLHALVATRLQHGTEIVAVHIDHGLQDESGDWERHCRDLAATLGAGYASERVQVDSDAGGGTEAAARNARYAAFRHMVRRGDWLLSAHHQEDQAETLLLNLLRGSGPAGMAGIAPVQAFAAGHLMRPLLGEALAALRHYAKRHELHWLEDPSNRDTAFDRNYLRREVMPLLAARWPAAAARFRQSAALATESGQLLDDLADIDLRELGGAARLSVSGLAALSLVRQRNVLRRAVRKCGLPSVPATRLYQAVRELIPARDDATPLVRWPGGEMRRYRDRLYLLPPCDAVAVDDLPMLNREGQRLELGPGQGELRLIERPAGGIDATAVAAGLRVRYRKGGEEIRPSGHRHTRKLKKLLQDEGVVPWMRQRIPLLYADDRIVAVADLWVADEYAAKQGWGVCWEGGPALF